MFCGFFLWANILMCVRMLVLVLVHIMCIDVDMYTSTTFATNHYPRHCKQKRWHINLGFSHFKYKRVVCAPYLGNRATTSTSNITKLKLSTYFTQRNAWNVTLFVCISGGACVCRCRLIDTNSWIWMKHEQNTDDLFCINFWRRPTM